MTEQPPPIRPLSSLSPGDLGKILTVRGERSLRRRLLELGFVTGSEIRMVGTAPLGDPLRLVLRGRRISLRKADAAGIDLL